MRSGKMKVQLISASGDRIEGHNFLKKVDPSKKLANAHNDTTISTQKDDSRWNVTNSHTDKFSRDKSSAFNSQNNNFNRDTDRFNRNQQNRNQQSWPSKQSDSQRHTGNRSQRFESAAWKSDSPNFKTHDITMGAYLDVTVVHVVTPSDFYCQLQTDSNKLLELQETILDDYSQLSGCVLETPCTEMPCCAIFSEDQSWYRAKILSVSPTGVTVQFVDFGNDEKVSLDCVKELKPQYFELPAQGIRCCLSGVLPSGGSWSVESVEKFKDKVLDKSFVGHFVKRQENGTYEINIIAANNVEEDHFRNELVSSGYAKLDGSIPVVRKNPFASHTVPNYVHQNLKAEHKENVNATWFIDPSEFYCQLSSQSGEFVKKMETMQAFYNGLQESEGRVDNPVPRMPCVCRFSEDNAWYRSEIVRVNGNKIEITYVDYGNGEEVSRNKLRHLLGEFATIPVQGLKCSLIGIEPPDGMSTWPALNANEVHKLMQGSISCVFQKKVSDKYFVHVEKDGIDVAQQLVTAGHAAVAGSVSHMRFKEINVALKSDPVPVVVAYAHSASSFYCQFPESADSLEDLMTLMESQQVGDGVPVVDKFEDGDVCLARYSEDNRWYRGIVKSCQDGGKYEVSFIDYGNSEIVDLNEVTGILKFFFSVR